MDAALTSIYNYKLYTPPVHQDQPEDGPTVGPKHVARIII